MLRWTLAAVTTLLAVGVAPAQDTPRIFSRPTLPPREALDRLNLKVGWRTYAATDGPRDAIKSVLLAGDDIFVHTRSGLVTCIDSDTGQTRWRTTTGLGYPAVSGICYNSRTVFTVNGTLLTAFDRLNGRQLWQWEIPGTSISTAPYADEERLYLSHSNNKLQVYLLPGIGPKAAPAGPVPNAPPPDAPRPVPPLGGNPVIIPEQDRSVMGDLKGIYGSSGTPLSAVSPLTSAGVASRGIRAGAIEPLILYEHLCEGSLDNAPVMGLDGLLFSGGNGTIFSVSRRVGKELFPGGFVTGGTITTPPRGHGDMAYVVGGDNVLYAMKISSPTGRRYWRFTKGGAILHRPAVTDDSVFVGVERGGLWRLDRDTGLEVWGNLEADRFLAANAKFVYALDRSGRLMVLDRKRGTKLSGYDTRGFHVPIINDATDRIYLSAHDGLIACIHDKDYAAALAMRTGDAAPVRRPQPVVPGVEVGPNGNRPKAPGGVEVGPDGMPKEKKDGVEVGPDEKKPPEKKDGVEVGKPKD